MKKINAAFDEPATAVAALQKDTHLPGLSLFSEIREAVYRYPSVCMVLPFNPKMEGKIRSAQQLQAAVLNVEKKLSRQYPSDVCYLLSVKLRAIAGNINFNTHKQSLAIFLSPVFEKVYYLNMAVEERIWVDESFTMRALLQAKKVEQHYLLLTLGSNRSEVFMGNPQSLERLLHYAAGPTAVKETSSYATQADVLNETQPAPGSLKKVLQHIDQLLHEILTAWKLPLIVMGEEGMLSHFKQLTKHAAAIVAYVRAGNGLHDTCQMLSILGPLLRSGGAIHQKYLQNKLDEAAAKHELHCGINDVVEAVKKRRGRLLLISAVDNCLKQRSTLAKTSSVNSEPYNSFSCISDDVDAMIETLLLNDGEVVMVNEPWMRAYDHIALV